MTRKLAFLLHGRVGQWLAMPLAFVFLTGALAVYGRELEALAFPAAACAGTQRGHLDVAWSVLAERALAAVDDSDARVLSLSAPEEDGAAAWALVQVAPRQYRYVFLDPRDGHARGVARFATPRRFLRDVHRSWMLGENVGLTIVTSLSLLLLVSLVTGLRVWARRHPPERWRRTHRLAGIALVPFLLVVIVTTVWYWGENLAGFFDVRPSGEIPSIGHDDVARVRRHEETMPVDVLVSHARSAYPELEVRFVSFPSVRRPVFSVSGHAGEGPLVRELANQVYLHPFNGDVLEVERATDLGAIAWWEHAVDAIHFGTWGDAWGLGALSRVLWLLGGLGSALLTITGFVVRRRRLDLRAPAPRRP
ncbi:MAG: PepSY-associated TM helix domain-containing protein [Sandaracinus sp.]